VDHIYVGSSLEVSSPTASPRTGQRHSDQVCLTWPPAPTGFLNLMALSSAPSLLALFHARSAHGVRPTELFSSRAAVRCSQRLCPHDVQVPQHAFQKTSFSSRMPKRRAGATDLRIGKPAGMPSPSRLYSTRESATSSRRFRPDQARSSLGFPPLQGALPRWNDNGLHRVSPHEVTRTADKSTDWTLYRVSLPDEIGWSLARLPTLLGFVTF
jgi:hypothetical protein